MDSNRSNYTPKICIIGAGFSGLCMAIQLKQKLNLESFTIAEACSELGGTWHVNTYPGCACDVASHLYSLSFSPKYDWSQTFAPQPEILEYMKDVAQKYNIYLHIRFQTKVQTLRWDENKSKWHASIVSTQYNREIQEEFDIIVNGTGKIRIPHYPKEYLNFQGPLLHSAKWDHSVSLSGKRVGVIGTGASAVQLTVALAPQVQHLTVFQRSAPYIIPRIQRKYSDVENWAFSNIPGLYNISRTSLFLLYEQFYGITRYNSWKNLAGVKMAEWYRNSQIQDPVLRKKTTPNYSLAGKRTILSENYYPTLQRENVSLVTEKIEGVEGHRVKTCDGVDHELDVLVLATGYQPHDYFSPMKIYGKDGVDVLGEWKKGRPKAYMGIMSSEMPNLFTLLGPYTAVGHNSNVFNIECQVNWTIKAIKKMLKKGSKSISVKTEAEEEFMQWLDKHWEESVWGNDPCGSWYVDAKGENTTLWTHNQVEFWRRCKTADDRLFEFKN